jgi:hypothetical protein
VPDVTFTITVSGQAPASLRAIEGECVHTAAMRMVRRLEDAGLTVSYATVNGEFVRGEYLSPVDPPRVAPSSSDAARKVAPKRRR